MRIGIIGAGGAARGIHLPGFRLCPDAEIAVLCEPDANAAKTTGVEAICADYRDVLRRPDIDAVLTTRELAELIRDGQVLLGLLRG